MKDLTDDELTNFRRVFIDKTRIDRMSAEGPEAYLSGVMARLDAAENCAKLIASSAYPPHVEAYFIWLVACGKGPGGRG
jgi:hypothetical protein